MDDTFKGMDKLLKTASGALGAGFVSHLAPVRRLHPHPCRVDAIGYIPHKEGRIDRAFATMNVSFILSGQGEYALEGVKWPIVTPCAITQWPGRLVQYGPTPEWEELYFIFEADAAAEFARRRLVTLDKPVWYFNDAAVVRDMLLEVQALGTEPSRRGTADRIDRLAERLVLESLLAEAPRRLDPQGHRIRLLRTRIEREFLVDHDFDGLAREMSCSPATFRRRWLRYVGVSPRRYVVDLRIRQACRMLVETGLSVAEIAAASSFSDPLYFSRVFRRTVGETATEYRRHHRLPGRDRGLLPG